MTKIELGTIVAVVLAIIGGALYIGRLEGRIDRVDPSEVQKKINDGIRAVNDVKLSLEATLEDIKKHINEKNIVNLVTIECGKEYPRIEAPEGTKTHDWLVFGVNPNINARGSDPNPYDNAIYAIATTIKPNKGLKSWSISYNVTIDIDTRRTDPKRGESKFRNCGSFVSPLQIYAIKANQKIQ